MTLTSRADVPHGVQAGHEPQQIRHALNRAARDGLCASRTVIVAGAFSSCLLAPRGGDDDDLFDGRPSSGVTWEAARPAARGPGCGGRSDRQAQGTTTRVPTVAKRTNRAVLM